MPIVCPICHHETKVFKCDNCKRSFQLEPEPTESQAQVAREAAVEWGKYEGWPDSSDIAEMQKRFFSAIERATQALINENTKWFNELQELRATPASAEQHEDSRRLSLMAENGWFLDRTANGYWELRDKSGDVLGQSVTGFRGAIDAAAQPQKERTSKQ